MSETVSPLKYCAYAKVNLSLEITGKRSDGYHELVSVMQTIDLADELELHDAGDVRFSCSEPELENAENLVFRAARLLDSYTRSIRGCGLNLIKSIPQAAGLGGGSSDAAATLRALNDWWSLDLPLEELVQLAMRLGSDVPFFLYGGTALVAGKGECVQRLPEPDVVWYALVKPEVAVPTGEIFRALSADDWTDGLATQALAGSISQNGHVSLGSNSLQRALFELYPAARQCFEDVARLAPGRTFVSGSGPTVGVLCRSRGEAAAVVETVAGSYRWTAVTRSVRGQDE